MNISSVIRTLGAAAALLAPVTAFADCSDVGSGRWNELSAKMGQAYEQADYNTALDYGKQLAFICDKAPIANYMLSETYRAMGRDEDALSSIRRATDYLSNYDLPQNLIEKIWLRRGELELPYKKQAEALQAQLDAKQIELEALDNAYKEQLTSQANDNSDSLSSAVSDTRQKYIDELYDIQWTGTGLAAGGVAFIGAGAALVGLYYGKAGDNYKKLLKGEKNHFNEYNSYEKFGYGFLAAGVGLGIAGMVTAIIAHVKINAAEAEEQDFVNAVKFDVSPSYVGMTVNF